MVKPSRTLFLLLIVFGITMIVLAWFPSGGIRINDNFKIQFPDWESFWTRDTSTRKVALQELFDIYALKVDSTAIKDSIQLEKVKRQQEMKKLQFPNGNPEVLKKFVEGLRTLKTDGGKLRIIHYGDSQIEGDRITGYLRHKLRSSYGGTGPGWLPVIEVIPSPLTQYNYSDNWIRYTAYGRDQSEIHKRYGITGAFARFLPEDVPEVDSNNIQVLDSALLNTLQKSMINAELIKEVTKAWFEISPDKRGYSGTRKFEWVRLAYGNVSTDIHYKIWADEALIMEGILPYDSFYHELNFQLEATPAKLRFEFEGTESPDFYGISIESKKGIIVDNIPMRGSSGTLFNKMDAKLLSRQFSVEPVRLLLLQFGGNSVPYVKEIKQANDYGNWFKSQIRSLKRMNPEASVIVIGPSDMSIKEKDKFITYPYLVEVRNALKEAAFEQGSAYWDPYEAMGGSGSMPLWVAADPPLASADHIHFTPLGAKMIAEWFYDALIEAINLLESTEPSL